MQATRQTPPTAHVTRFDAALDGDVAAAGDVDALAAAPPMAEALRVALWIGAAAGVLTPDAAQGMQTTAQAWRKAETLGMQALRATAAGDGPLARQAARDLRRALAASRAGRLAAMGSWAARAAPPPGPGAMEENLDRLLASGGAAVGRAGGAETQMRISRLVAAAETAMARAVAEAAADHAEAAAPHPLAFAAFAAAPRNGD